MRIHNRSNRDRVFRGFDCNKKYLFFHLGIVLQVFAAMLVHLQIQGYGWLHLPLHLLFCCQLLRLG